MANDDKKQTLAERFNIACPHDIDHDETVLVVEDQQDLRLIIAHHLNKMGFRRVQQTSNGYDALEFIGHTEHNISLIMCDIDMPVMGGFDLLHELKENPEYERSPFAISMDNPSKERIMLALENGVDEVVVKPFTLADIFPKMQSTFRKFHNPRNPEKVYEHAKALYRDGKLDESENVYKIIAAETSVSARPWVGLARIAMKRGNMQAALHYLNDAEKANQHFVHLYSTRGQIFMQEKKLEEAIAAFKKAIELSPLNPVRYREAVDPLFTLHRYQEAVDILSVAINNNLNFPMLHNYLSQGFFALKDFKKAVRHIKVALAEQPQNVTYLNQLGICQKECHEFEESMKAYNTVIKLDPENKSALYNKSILLATQGQYDEAIKILTRLATKFPDFAPAKTKITEFQNEKNNPMARKPQQAS